MNGLADMLTHPFIRNALLAGIPISALCGALGYFLLLRRQIFAADALSHVAFTGALAALALGIDARAGLFAATIAAGLLLGTLRDNGDHDPGDDVLIGAAFAWILGLGALALSLYTSGSRATSNAAAGVNVLFGSIVGLSAGRARPAALIAVVLIAVLTVIARPLLFASLDEAVALARGVPVRWLGIAFLGLVGAAAAEATQAVGALLLLGLLAAPAGAAHRLTARPLLGSGLAALLATTAMITGLTSSYLWPDLPPSFAVLACAALIYAVSFAGLPRSARGRAVASHPPVPCRASQSAQQPEW
jgi:zinc/manganese transport system permease protein